MTVQITKITDDFSVAPQISEADIAEIAKLGFKTIINNRPDGEGGAEQPVNASLQQQAETAGVDFIYIPVIPNNIQADQVALFGDEYNAAEKPVLAFCRTGNRAGVIFKKALDAGEID